MKKIILILSACVLSAANLFAAPARPAIPGALTFREIHYAGKLSDDEARFTVDVDAETTGDSSVPLLEGDVAVLPAKLPDAVKILRDGNRYLLASSRAGHFKFQLVVVARIQRAEPWN